MKIITGGLAVLILMLLNVTCRHVTDPDNPAGGIISLPYLNSFESRTDTTGWEGYGAFDFRNDAAPNGGSQSLFVTGGCPVPHAYFDLGKVNRDCFLKIRCWGKDLDIGGSVSLQYSDAPSPQISLIIDDSQWMYYESEGTLFCPAGQAVRICLNSGGFAPSSMLVDLLEVVLQE